MDEISKLLPGLPSWFTIPIVLITIALSLVPRIYKAVADLTASSREYNRERQRLAVLKLRYEIEALKKDKNLQDLPESLPIKAAQQTTSTSVSKLLNPWMRFYYGAIGAIIPPIVALVIHFWTPGPRLSVDLATFSASCSSGFWAAPQVRPCSGVKQLL